MLDFLAIIVSNGTLWSTLYQITELFQINRFSNKPWFLCFWHPSLVKTSREKEKLYITSNFSFSYSLEKFLPFSSNLILSSANSFNSEGKKFVDWERVTCSCRQQNKIDLRIEIRFFVRAERIMAGKWGKKWL